MRNIVYNLADLGLFRLKKNKKPPLEYFNIRL